MVDQGSQKGEEVVAEPRNRPQNSSLGQCSGEYFRGTEWPEGSRGVTLRVSWEVTRLLEEEEPKPRRGSGTCEVVTRGRELVCAVSRVGTECFSWQCGNAHRSRQDDDRLSNRQQLLESAASSGEPHVGAPECLHTARGLGPEQQCSLHATCNPSARCRFGQCSAREHSLSR